MNGRMLCKRLRAMIQKHRVLQTGKLSFNGGVVIIGSLLWDKDKGRPEWRERSLKNLETRIPVPLRIRYGRQSESRCDTYTMIFSNHPTTEFGLGYLVGFKKRIESEEMLKAEAIALATAEGIWTVPLRFLGNDWGSVGLMVNENKEYADVVRSIWKRIFQMNKRDHHQRGFDHRQFSIGDELPVIDSDGFLNIDWTPEMNEFDFLIATSTVPRPRSDLSASEIAERMIDEDCKRYFDMNREHNISTFQDDEILRQLRMADNRFACDHR